MYGWLSRDAWLCVLQLTAVALLCARASAELAICPYPPPEVNAVIEPKSLLPYENKGNFTSGDQVVYDCLPDEGRFGVIHIECLKTGQWSAGHRNCTDAIRLDEGSIVGIVFACATVFISVTFIIIAYCRTSDEEEGGEEKEEGARGATAAGEVPPAAKKDPEQ